MKFSTSLGQFRHPEVTDIGTASRKIFRKRIQVSICTGVWILGDRFNRRSIPHVGSNGTGRIAPRLEQCESRTLLTVYLAQTVADLLADVALSNAATTLTEIDLVAGTTYVDPAYARADFVRINNTQPLTINGAGATLQLQAPSSIYGYVGVPPLIEVDGGSVVFNNPYMIIKKINITFSGFSNGLVVIEGTATGNNVNLSGFASFGHGGAMYVGPAGTLNLNQLTIHGNYARQAITSIDGLGGGIYNAGVVNIVGGSVFEQRGSGPGVGGRRTFSEPARRCW